MYEQNRAYNTFETLPFIPYNILLALMKNENIFKILKYPDYMCLSKPNLTYQEKVALLWKNQDNQQDYNVFLTSRIENMVIDARTILKIYRYDDTPINTVKDNVSYEFDILYGDKIAMIDYNGVPCTRSDVLQMEILKTLNGEYINGLISPLQYDREMSRNCKAMSGLNMVNKYLGTSLVMAGQISCLKNENY